MQIRCGDPSKRIKDQDSCAITAHVNSNRIMVDAIASGNKCLRLSETTRHLPEAVRPGIGQRAKQERKRNTV